MRKMPALALLVLTALAVGSASPILLHAQNAVGTSGGTAAGNEDMPHRTARAFAPFLKALIQRRLNTAQQIFKMRRSVSLALESPETVQTLGRFSKPDRLDLNLVGGRTLGQNIGILFFTITNQEGPVAFKVYYYGFGEDIFISRMDISEEWDEIEQMATTMETLQTPVTVPLGMVEPGGQ